MLFRSGSALVASSLCFVLMIVAVYRMKKRERGLPGVPETVFMGVLIGLRFARHSLPMRSLLIRNVSFSLCANSSGLGAKSIGVPMAVSRAKPGC